MSSSSSTCHQFSLTEIRKATNNFDKRKILGRGGEGFVYLAEICLPRKKKKTPVAVKQLNPNSSEFEKEIQTISKIQHPNLVALLGYCKEPGQKILIYEYMANGCLSDYVKKKKITTCLSWKQRLNICIGAARGLQHLHTPTEEFPYGIIHRDVKPANILLDENWVAKVSDFGMSKLSQVGQTKSVIKTGLRGTCGYYAPEYLMHSQVSRKIDVYALGVVLFEVLCRKKPWDREDESYYSQDDDDLGIWAQENVDAEIEGQVSGDSLDAFTNIIGRSLKQDPSRRPTIDEVVLDLENALRFQEQADERVDPNSIPSEESEAEHGRLVESIDKIALDICEEGLSESSIEEIKFIDSELKKAASDAEGSLIDDLLKVVDRLVSCLTTKAAKIFDFCLRCGSFIRSCEYVLNTLVRTFENRRLGRAVKESSLESLVTEILLRLADERFCSILAIETHISNTLNHVMFKIVENAQQTSLFVILIKLLSPPDPSRWPVSPPSTDESFAMRRQELVVKCLIKLTKVLETTLEDIDLDRLLQSLHLYLQELGTEEIKRAAADYKPLKMVKTIIFHLVKLRGNAIRSHLSLVPMEPRSILVDHFLQQMLS